MFKSNNTILFYITIVCAVLLIPGCPQLTDIFPPELTILEPTGAEPVEPTFDVRLEVTDNDEVESVEIIIRDGGTEIAQQTLSAEPWETSLTVDDTVGYVTLEAKATDAVGNFVDAELSLQIIEESGSSPNITVTSPNGGENWEPGSSHSITWSSINLPGSYVAIQLYRNGSYVSSISSSTTDDGSYTWSIPSSQTESDYYQVKIYSTTTPDIYDMSDNNFSIGGGSSGSPTITVTSPNGGETWASGSNEAITWTSANIPESYNIFISLYKSGAFDRTIVGTTGYYGSPNDGTDNDGSYTWAIPSSLDESSYYKVRISAATYVMDADYGDYWETISSDYSDSYFTIEESSSPSITVTSPSGGEDWEPGTSHSITWNSANLSGNYVGIQLYRTGTYVSSISSSTTDDGSYTWSIPSSQTESDYYQVKIYSTSNSSVYDLSDNYFTIEEATSSSCNAPTNLQTTIVTTTSAVLDWDPASGAISYNVMYREYGYSWDMATDITTSSANWSGLSPSTTYQWQIQSDCGSASSSWSSTITFTTLDDGGGGGNGVHCDEPYYCSDCAGCAGNCCPNYCSGNYYYFNRTCSNGFCVGGGSPDTHEYCPNGCNDDGCI